MSEATPKKRMYVLDTNILLHDPYSVLKFAEHDVFIPTVTVEELDGKKQGSLDINRNARQATRLVRDIVLAGRKANFEVSGGYPINLSSTVTSAASGRLYIQATPVKFLEDEHFHKNDNLYIAVMAQLKETFKDTHDIIMVTKDFNLTLKLWGMDFDAEDYKHDHAVEDSDVLRSGFHVMSQSFEDFLAEIESKGGTYVATSTSVEYSNESTVHAPVYEITGVPHDYALNEFLMFEAEDALWRVIFTEGSWKDDAMSKGDHGDVVNVSKMVEHSFHIRRVFNLTALSVEALNMEQLAALDLLLDPEVDLVNLLGPAGTGKTLLTLAAGLSAYRLFDKILYTRATVAMGEDIGFLPGDEKEKMAPWLGAMYDNIEVLQALNAGNSKVTEMLKTENLEKRIDIGSIGFMRGRTFVRKLIILDEAQNLTAKQVKALITRAGEGSKVIMMGNLAQIDSPYLTETSSGLAIAAERFKNWDHFGSLILTKGERSRLANAGNERL